MLCSVDVTYYPFDDQVCNFLFVNWVYPGTQVNLTTKDNGIRLNRYQEDGEWSVLKTSVTFAGVNYDDDQEFYPEVRYKLYLRRKSTYYIATMIAPTVMMSLLVLLVFKLPPNSGEKVSMGVTLLLAYSVFILIITDILPSTSQATPLIGRTNCH